MDRQYYVVRTKTRREVVAAASLSSFGIHVVAPRVEEVRKTLHRDNIIVVPMFRGYIFAKLNLEYFYSLGQIHGVASLVSFGGPPPQVEASFVEELKSRMGRDGVIRLAAARAPKTNYLAPGDQVKIDQGVFSGYFGVFQQELDSDGRARVLLDSLYSTTIQPIVSVPIHYVARIQPH